MLSLHGTPRCVTISSTAQQAPRCPGLSHRVCLETRHRPGTLATGADHRGVEEPGGQTARDTRQEQPSPGAGGASLCLSGEAATSGPVQATSREVTGLHCYLRCDGDLFPTSPGQCSQWDPGSGLTPGWGGPGRWGRGRACPGYSTAIFTRQSCLAAGWPSARRRPPPTRLQAHRGLSERLG